MSCLRCDRCNRIIDTDADVEAYTETTDPETGKITEEWVCEPCREREMRLAFISGEF